MCRKEFLNWRRIREWQDVRAQLRRVTRDMRMHPNRKPAAPALIHESLLSGLLSQVGKKDPDGWEYRGARGARFAIRPGSVLFKRAPEWVMAGELVETTRTWATGVAQVDPDVVARVGDHLVRRSVSDPWWDPERGAAVARETTTLLGLPLTTDATVMYEHHDQAESRRLFIIHALVSGEWESHHAFVSHNEAEIDAVLEVEARERRSDLLRTDDEIAAFFDARIPADVTSARRFDHWWKDERGEHPHLLDLSPADIIDPLAAGIDEEAFPPVWQHGDLALALTYEFDPSSPDDGVTITIPASALDRVDPAVFEWNVPGLRTDIVIAMMRSLPKSLRKQFAPVPDTAQEIVTQIKPSDGRLAESMAKALTRRSGSIVRPDDFDLERIPTHLQPRYRIVDSDASEMAAGHDLASLRSELREAARSSLADTPHHLERDGITAWDFGVLPISTSIDGPGHTVVAYPALIDMGDSVSIRLMATADEQAEAMWPGLRKLVMMQLPSPRRLLRSVLDGHGPVPIVGSPYADRDEWMDDCFTCAVDSVLVSHDAVWDADGFDSLVASVRSDLGDAIERVGNEAVAALEALQDANRAIVNTPDAVFGDILDDVDVQLDRFVFPGFLTAVGAARLDDIRRYLEGIAYRLGRLPENPERDRERMTIINSLEAEHDQLTEVLTWSPELIEVLWMLQELRVSLFAQPVGAKGSISEKRVRAALEALLK